MTQLRPLAADEARNPPLAKDLDSVPVRYTWNGGEGGAPDPAGESPTEVVTREHPEIAALQAQVRRYTVALEDIVTLALSSADYKERAIMMHRRAVAALSAPTQAAGGGA